MAPGASETAIEDRRGNGDGRDEGVTSMREGICHAAEAKIVPHPLPPSMIKIGQKYDPIPNRQTFPVFVDIMRVCNTISNGGKLGRRHVKPNVASTSYTQKISNMVFKSQE